MNFGDYSGEYKSKVFKMLMMYFDIDIEGLSKLTGFTETHLEGILRQEVLENNIGKRILSAMNLTNNDYDWVHVVIHEVSLDRSQRIRKLDEIRFKQRQLKLDQEKERVKKPNGKETSKEDKAKRSSSRRNKSTKESESVKTSKGDKASKVSKERSTEESRKASTKEGSKGSEASSKGQESGDKTRKAIKKRKGGQKEADVQKRKGKSK